MASVIGVGDNTVDTYLHMRKRFPGGNAVNVAVHSRRLGARSAYLGVLGDDDNGSLILNALRIEGVDVSHCRILAGIPNAYAEVDLKDGERIFGRHDSGASALLRLNQTDLNFIRSFDVTHTSYYSHINDQMIDLKPICNILSYDFSDHLAEWERVKPIFSLTDIAIFSLTGMEAKKREDIIARLDPLPNQIVILTRGSQGAYLYANGKFLYQPVIPVQVVDTMGAGDAFIAAFLVEFVESGSLSQAMQKGAERAAENCLQMGAFGHGVNF